MSKIDYQQKFTENANTSFHTYINSLKQSRFQYESNCMLIDREIIHVKKLTNLFYDDIFT